MFFNKIDEEPKYAGISNLPEVVNSNILTACSLLSDKWSDGLLLKTRSKFGSTLIEKKYFYRRALNML